MRLYGERLHPMVHGGFAIPVAAAKARELLLGAALAWFALQATLNHLRCQISGTVRE